MSENKIIPVEVLRRFMEDSKDRSERAIVDSDGVFEPGEDTFFEALAEKVNRFFSGDTGEVEYVEVKTKIYNAKFKKPDTSRAVLVNGGCAYWDGINWRTLMDVPNYNTFPVISWPVTWWADLPKGYEF